jgi:penicillin-binding protein 1A
MRKRKRSLLKIILASTFIAISLVIIGLVLFFALVNYGIFGTIPDKDALSEIRNEEASLVYSSDRIIIGKYFAQNRTNIKWNDIPDHLKNALIATEDKRFFSHKGYDTQSYLRVIFRTLLLGDKSGGGGSTLTQQLVKNLYGRDEYGWLSLPVNKIKEIILATRIEEVYTKEELILLYLNSVPFGEDVYGVESASQRFFNKSAVHLKTEESAVLIGLLKANTYFNPQLHPENSLSRRNTVLKLMEKSNYLTAEEADSLQKTPLKLDYENLSLNAPAGYFVYQVKKQTREILDEIEIRTGKKYNLEKDGLKIYTTLNFQIQEYADEAVKNHLSQMQKKLDSEIEARSIKSQWIKTQRQKSKSFEKDKEKTDRKLFTWEGMQVKNISLLDSLWHYYKMLHASVLITNPKTGEVITWIGGNQFKTMPFDMVLSHRQIASAFKPILYATAIENGISPCTYLENEERIYSEYEGWKPENADHSSTPDSTVAMWYALAHSMNLPTVDLFFKTGAENLMNSCNRLKFPTIYEATPSMALGTSDISLYEIVKAYGSFANNGQMNDLVMINKILDSGGNIIYTREPKQAVTAFSIETSQLVTAVLQQAVNQGTGTRIRSQYGIQADLAAKTGTANDYSNAWFIAYTPELVFGTWVGASTPDIHFYSGNGSGSALALPIVAAILKKIENNNTLNRNYLTPFGFSEDIYSFLLCDAYKQKGVGGFFNRLLNQDAKKEKEIIKPPKKEKEEKGVRSFFKKIFKRNT